MISHSKVVTYLVLLMLLCIALAGSVYSDTAISVDSSYGIALVVRQAAGEAICYCH